MAEMTRETQVAEEAGGVGDLANDTEHRGVADVADVADGPFGAEEKDESHVTEITEVTEEEDAADLVENTDVADLREMTQVAEKKHSADLVETGEAADKGDVADLVETREAMEKGDAADLVETSEATEKGDVADLVEVDVANLVETGEAAEKEYLVHLAEAGEPAEKGDAADLLETRDTAEEEHVANLVETGEATEKKDVADLVGTGDAAEEDYMTHLVEKREAAEEGYVADLSETREAVEEGYVAHLSEAREAAEEECVAHLAETTVAAEEADVEDLAETMEAAKKADVADLAEVTGFAEEEYGADLAEVREVAEEEDVADVLEEKNFVGNVAENVEMSGPIAMEEDLAGPVADETDLAGPVAEETDALGSVFEVKDVRRLMAEGKELAGLVVETNSGVDVDEMEEEVEEENVADAADETMEAEEILAEKATEAEDTEAVEVADMAEETTEAEETEAAEEMDATEEMEVAEASRGTGGGKRKRGKNSRAPARVPTRKKMEEDVCFICFDGGELVLCDRRGCPKAYHPSCVNRDEAFFRTKGRWNCGWHLCSNCEKNAYYMCYTCTFSLCKSCIKDAVILCVRGNKGFCETCMRTVKLIEHNLEGNEDMGQMDFDDKSSWEYLFKDYWIDLKEKLSLTLDELNQARNPWKVSDVFAGKQESPNELYDANNDEGSDSDSSSGNTEISNSKRRKSKKRLKPRSKENDSPAPARASGAEGPSLGICAEWGSKELLEFVMHMKNGDRSVLSQFDVQALLLEYIKRNKLRDPRRKSQIICDSRLQSLFGKPRVGHFEMLKLLESHFLIKEDSQADELQGSVVDTEASQLENVGISDSLVKTGRDKKRKSRKKGDERGSQSNLDDYAAIDIHNINLIYLRRNLVEELLEDSEKLHDKVVGSFVRIRISGSGQKQDLYRLVQVVGTCKAAEPYKVGKRMTDTLLEILNLNKTEIVSIDIISNQEFTEDECKRLRQSIKCGLINRLTVGDIQEKAMVLQEARVKDWLETETVRLSHLRDRASEKGRRKELRECVEKLQLLKMPEERQRRLEEIPEIHVDPNMDPSYESEEDEGDTDDKRQETYMRPRGSGGFGRRGREPLSPQTGGSPFSDSWNGTRNSSDMGRELSRNMSSKVLSYKGDDAPGVGEIVNDRNQGRDREAQHAGSWEKQKISATAEIGTSKTQSAVQSEAMSAVQELSAAPPSTMVAQSAATFNETEKMWHYQDPSGKVQGPFSVVQLRKWNNTGYFPANLRIWRTAEKQDNSILLSDALAGKYQRDPPLLVNSFPKPQVLHNTHISSSYTEKPHGAPLQQGMEGQVGEKSNFDERRGALNSHSSGGTSGQTVGGSWRVQNEVSPMGKHVNLSVEPPRISSDRWGTNNGNDSTNLPSPTPIQTTTGVAMVQPYETKWLHNSFQPASSVMGAGSGGNGGLQPPPAVITETAVQGSQNNGASSHPGLASVLNIEKSVLVSSINALQMHTQSTVPPTVLADASKSPGADMKSTGPNFHNMEQAVANHNPPLETQGWGSGSVPKPEMITSGALPGSESQSWGSAPSQKVEPNNPATMPQPLAFGNWGDPSVQISSSFSTGNPGGNFPIAGFSGLPPSNPWRHPLPGNQSNIQPPAPATLTWGMGVAENQTAGTRTGPENQTTGWGPMPGNPNMGWGGPVPGNVNLNWVASGQGPGPGNGTAVWAPPVQAPGNAVPSWVPGSQGLPMGNANPSWVAPGQGPPPGNVNPGWAAPTGNPGNNGERLTNQSVRGSHGGDSGYSGGKPWNRQSSFGGGGGGSRPPFKGQRVCKYYEGGHCKKGASCDYLHP